MILNFRQNYKIKTVFLKFVCVKKTLLTRSFVKLHCIIVVAKNIQVTKSERILWKSKRIKRMQKSKAVWFRRKTSSLAFQIQQYEDGIFGVSVVHFIVSLNVESCLLHTYIQWVIFVNYQCSEVFISIPVLDWHFLLSHQIKGIKRM